jgi:OOP family OmpA-OmpF porin
MFIVAGLLLSTGPAPAFAQDDAGFYVGGGIGQSELKDACDGDGLTVTDCDDTDTAWKLFAGYSFNKYFAVEGGYIDFGEASLTGTELGIPFSATAEAWGITAHAVGALPIWEGFSIIGRAGAVFWNVDTEVSALGLTASEDDDGISLAVGAGVQWMFGRNFGIRAEYEFFDGIGDDETTGESDIQVLSLSVLFKF